MMSAVHWDVYWIEADDPDWGWAAQRRVVVALPNGSQMAVPLDEAVTLAHLILAQVEDAQFTPKA